MRKEPIVVSEDIISVATKYDKICLFLDERSRRMWCAVEAESYGYGGILLVNKATLSINLLKNFNVLVILYYQ
jgi:DDE family transposase